MAMGKILNQVREIISNVAPTLGYISKKERESIPEEDFGWPEEKKYPIRSQSELDSAAKLIGRAPKDKQGSIKARIKKIAERKGYKLPDSWK